MILYILRFSLSLLMVYGFYKLVLEKERVFSFNRFYLLFGLGLSLMIPMVSLSGPEQLKTILNTTQHHIEDSIIKWDLIIDLIYVLISSVFLVRFGLNVQELLQKAKTSEVKALDGAKVVLVEEAETPNSFLNYIFINKLQFEQIEPELLKHELAHVQQKHTVDVLIIELLKTLFWINPLLAHYKKAMQLNHEFLADRSAIAHTKSTSAYQKTLLAYLSHEKPINIASGFNFSLTKKRFIMMTKPKSNTAILKQMLVVPLMAFILWSCSDNGGVSGKEMLHYWRYTANMEEVLRTGDMSEKDRKEGIIIPLETRAQYDELQDIYNRMSKAQKESVYALPPYLEPIK